MPRFTNGPTSAKQILKTLSHNRNFKHHEQSCCRNNWALKSETKRNKRTVVPLPGSAAADNSKMLSFSITDSPPSRSHSKCNLPCEIRRKKSCHFAFILGPTFKPQIENHRKSKISKSENEAHD